MGILALSVCLAGNTTALATTIIAIWTPERLVLGADSRLITQGQSKAASSLGCKIGRDGDVFVAAAGILAYGAPINFSAYKMAFSAALAGGTTEAIANRFDLIARAPFLRAVSAIQRRYPSYFGETCQGLDCVEVAIAKVRDGRPELSVRGFKVVVRGGAAHVTLDKGLDIDCPEDCGRRRTITLGAADVAKQLSTHGAMSHGVPPVSEAAMLITMESVFHPQDVSPPISILELDKRGAHWAPGYQGKCPKF